MCYDVTDFLTDFDHIPDKYKIHKGIRELIYRTVLTQPLM